MNGKMSHEAILDTIRRAPVVRSKNGEPHSRGIRWVDTLGLPIEALWPLHLSGAVELSRCDLPQVWQGGFEHQGLQRKGALFHFVRIPGWEDTRGY